MYKLSKALFALFMINYIWGRRAIGTSLWISYLLLAGFAITGLLASNDLSKRKALTLKFNKYSMYWAIFIIYVVLTGFAVAQDFSIVLSQAMFLFEVLLIILYVNLIADTEGSLKFIYILFMVIAALYTFSMLRSGYIHARGRLYMNENSNPNGDGLVLAFGIYSTLKLIDFKRMGILIPCFALTIVEMYTIFLTGSRKALIIAALFFVFSFLRIWNLRKELSNAAKLFIGALSVAVIALGVLWLLPVYRSSTTYLRMQTADISLQDRWKIAYDALIVFSNHPIFGVGINNYRLYNQYGLYAHSTIPELLSGTGIIGTIIFFIPYFSVFSSISNKRMKGNDRIEIRRLLFCILLTSFVIIIPYSMPLSFFSVIMFYETELSVNREFNNNTMY